MAKQTKRERKKRCIFSPHLVKNMHIFPPYLTYNAQNSKKLGQEYVKKLIMFRLRYAQLSYTIEKIALGAGGEGRPRKYAF